MKQPLALLVLGAVILGASTYLYLQDPSLSQRHGTQSPPETTAAPPAELTVTSSALQYIPADTVLFFGSLQPPSIAEASRLASFGSEWMEHTDTQKQIAELRGVDGPPGMRMLASMYAEYISHIGDIAAFAAQAGFPAELDSAFYTVGVVPVWRAKLENPGAFEQFIDRVEAAAQVTPNKGTVGDTEYRMYTFAEPTSGQGSEFDFVVAVHEGFGVMTFATPIDRERVLAQALGIEKPAASLAASGRLQKVASRYGFQPAYIGYLNHKEIVKGLTQAGGNDFGRMIDLVAAMGNAAGEQNGATPPKDPLAPLRTPECQDELMAVAENWPQTVFGYTRLDTSERPIAVESRMVIESNGSELLSSLQTLRGHIPIHFRGGDHAPVLGVAVGLNTDALLPFVNKLSASLSSASYQCEVLASMQRGLTAGQPAAGLGMFSGMVAGLRGISLALMDLDLKPNPARGVPQLRALDAIVTISAENPQSLLTTATSMAPPPLAGLQVPGDGTPVALPVPMPLPNGLVPQAAIKGKHIVLYAGEQAEAIAEQMAEESLAANGMFSMALDYGKYFNVLADSMAGQMPEEQRVVFEALESFDADVTMSFAPEDRGLVFSVAMTMP